jgi:outer membrane receptor protein involved in Fe transport
MTVPAGTFPIYVNPDLPVRAYFNLNNQTRKGLELSLDRSFGQYFGAFANYTYQKGEYDASNVSMANTIINSIPKHIFNAGVNFNYGPFGAKVTGNYISDRNGEGVPSGIYDVSSDGRLLVNFSATMNLFTNYKLNLTVANLLDKEYLSGGYYGPGRDIVLSLTATY